MRVEQFRAHRLDLRNGPPRRAWQAGRQDGGTPPRCPRGRAVARDRSRGVDLVVGDEHARLRNAAGACTSLRARLECRTGTSSAAAREMPTTPARPCHLAWQDARQALRRAHPSAHRRTAQAHPPAIADAHARYLESQFISLATQAGRSRLTNATAPPPPPLPEADRSDMEYYIAQAKIVLPVLGINLLRAPSVPPAGSAGAASGQSAVASPTFTLHQKKEGITATARAASPGTASGRRFRRRT